MIKMLLNEVVAYGPFTLTRGTVRKLAMIEGFDARAADYIAFGCLRAVDAEAMTLIDVADFLDDAHGAGYAAHIRASG